jgi:hypothetical protein
MEFCNRHTPACKTVFCTAIVALLSLCLWELKDKLETQLYVTTDRMMLFGSFFYLESNEVVVSFH